MLDCYWVGSFNFNFVVETKVFSTKPPKSDPLCRGLLSATKHKGVFFVAPRRDSTVHCQTRSRGHSLRITLPGIGVREALSGPRGVEFGGITGGQHEVTMDVCPSPGDPILILGFEVNVADIWRWVRLGHFAQVPCVRVRKIIHKWRVLGDDFPFGEAKRPIPWNWKEGMDSRGSFPCSRASQG